MSPLNNPDPCPFAPAEANHQPTHNDWARCRHAARTRYLTYALAQQPLAALLDAALEDLRLAGGDGDDIMLLRQRAQRERNSQK